jgi:serine/threonine protein kinase
MSRLKVSRLAPSITETDIEAKIEAAMERLKSHSTPPGDVEFAMLAWFPSNSKLSLKARKPFTESDLKGISDVLRRTGKEPWSKIPRIYSILRIIGQIQIIDSFLVDGLSDLWLPFTFKTLPEALKDPSSRVDFLEAQNLVLSKALDLEREDGKHRHFSKEADIPFTKIAELGKGGFGYVDRVLSTISYKEYARKLIPRGRTFKKDQTVLRDFERELANLKRLSHPHIIELVGSYTDPRFVGIIMSPVADCNLREFLDASPLSAENLSLLRTFFGCLTAALCYLHENRIRHKDIKPQNVLVKGHQVFLTDFGISLDWTELGHSTTSGPTIRSPRYCSPEVADDSSRNSSSDVWSLGCIFLEMWTVLVGETVAALLAYLEKTDEQETRYYLNLSAVESWCSTIGNRPASAPYPAPRTWIANTMRLEQQKRWTAQMLLDRIQEVNADEDTKYTFSGLCCLENDESAESVYSPSESGEPLETKPLADETVKPFRPGSTKEPEMPTATRNTAPDAHAGSGLSEFPDKWSKYLKSPMKHLEGRDLMAMVRKGEVSVKNGKVLDQKGKFIGEMKLVQEPMTDLPFFERFNMRGAMLKIESVLNKDGDIIAKLSKGDLAEVEGREIRANGEILGRTGNIIGKVEFVPKAINDVPESPKFPRIDIVEGLKVNKKGEVINEDGEALAKLSEGILADVKGKVINEKGEVLGMDGNVIGKVKLVPEAFDLTQEALDLLPEVTNATAENRPQLLHSAESAASVASQSVLALESANSADLPTVSLVDRAKPISKVQSLINEFRKSQAGQKTIKLGTESAADPSETQWSHSATSVDYGKGHARNINAGSAKLLDLPRRISNDEERSSPRPVAPPGMPSQMLERVGAPETNQDQPPLTTIAPNIPPTLERIRVHAKYSFTAEDPGELSVEAGEELKLLFDTPKDGWWTVRRVRDNSKGVVPVTYIEIMYDDVGLLSMNVEGRGSGRALYEFTAQTPDKLTLKKRGDTLHHRRYQERRVVAGVAAVRWTQGRSTSFLH